MQRLTQYYALLQWQGLARELYNHEAALPVEHGRHIPTGIASIDRNHIPSFPGSFVSIDGRPCAKVGSVDRWSALAGNWAVRLAELIEKIRAAHPENGEELLDVAKAVLALTGEVHARLHWMFYYDRPLHDQVHPLIAEAESARFN